MLKESAIEPGALSDLGWLDPTQVQDPSRLPFDDHDALTELHDIWDSNNPARNSGGIALVPGAQDRAAANHRREVEGYQAPTNALDQKLANDRFKAAIQQAVRKASYGESLSIIARDTETILGKSKRAKLAVDMVAQEHGLLGNVFIRASAFPGLEGGKWAKRIKRRAKSAQYIIAAEGSSLAQYDVFLGKQVVQEVPWKEAFNHYASRLLTLGYVIPKEGSYKSRLKAAFENGVTVDMRPKAAAEFKPVWVAPADLVSLEQAHEIFASTPVPEQVVLDPSSKRANLEKKQALVRVAKWVKAQLLTREDAIRLASDEQDPNVLLDKASKLVLAGQRKARVYQGGGEGVLDVLRLDPEKQAMRAEASAWKDRPTNMMVRWARIQMTEGSIGHELDMLIEARFSTGDRTANLRQIEDIRDQHEGLSGHVYVDAAAYASKVGTVGCEAGALRHRANPLKFALSMSRCGACVFNHPSADGEICQKYNKILVAEAPVEDPVSYQVAAIKMANSSDQEQLASLFANNYENDFSLNGDQMDYIQLDSATNTASLGGVLWGGMVLD
jgi:hypothetical protein